MGLDMWFKDDIKNILLAISMAAEAVNWSRDTEELAYWNGYRAALTTVARTFGIALKEGEEDMHGLVSYRQLEARLLTR
jgi:hypothetical protein